MSAQVFYPSCVVHLVIRFDEALIGGAVEPKPVSTNEAAARPATKPLPASFKPVSAQPASGDKGDGLSVFVLNRVPVKCTVDKAGVRAAGTFNLTFAFQDLPLDPRTIRQLGVEIHMGCVSAEDFARGMRGERRADGSLYSVLRTREPGGGVRPSTLVMIGVADDIEEEYGNTGLTLRIVGRDQRGILLSSPLAPDALNKLDYSLPLPRIIEQLLARHPITARTRIRSNAAEWPDGRIPAALPPEILPRHRVAARGRGNRRPTAPHPPGGGQAGAQLTFWDAITRLCFLCNAVPTFVQSDLWIRPTRGLFEQVQAGPDGTIHTPFYPDVPRESDGGQLVVRRMVIGDNTSRLTFKRKIGGLAKPKTIRCVAVNLEEDDRTLNRIVEGRWPPAAVPPTQARGSRRAHTAPPGGGPGQEEIENVSINDCRDPVRLTEIARALYEEIGRKEIEGSYETNSPTSYGGNNDDPDLLRANPGDVIELVMASGTYRAGGTPTALSDHYGAPYEERVRELTRRLGDERLARAIAATARGRTQPLQRLFRLSALSLTWGEKGILVRADIQNYYFVPNNEDPTETKQAPGAGETLIVKGR